MRNKSSNRIKLNLQFAMVLSFLFAWIHIQLFAPDKILTKRCPIKSIHSSNTHWIVFFPIKIVRTHNFPCHFFHFKSISNGKHFYHLFGPFWDFSVQIISTELLLRAHRTKHIHWKMSTWFHVGYSSIDCVWHARCCFFSACWKNIE